MSRLAMVVEDDDGLRMIYRRVLGKMDYEVIEAADGETALQTIEAITPDILFLDIQLPLLNGEAILEYILDAPHLQDTYVIIVSSNKQYAVYVKQLPAAEFVLKPIRPAQIREFASRSLA